MYKINKYNYKILQTVDIQKINIYKNKLLQFGGTNVTVIENTLLNSVNFENKTIGYGSDHALIRFIYDSKIYYSWNLLNQDEYGSTIHTFNFIYGKRKVPSDIFDGRIQKIIEKLNSLELDSIICLQEVGKNMYQELIKGITNREIIATNGDNFLGGKRKEEYLIILLPKGSIYIEKNIPQFIKMRTPREYRNNLLINFEDKWICNIHLHHKSSSHDTIDFIYNVIKQANNNVLFIGDTNNRMSSKICEKFNTKFFTASEPTFITEMESCEKELLSSMIDGYFYIEKVKLNFFN
jgi:hypothetical protein